jgi:hypothetical protein|tara:strand:+ start:118 stop:387 length:270 start_codon:yes stop_codon:yes gene_type:complete
MNLKREEHVFDHYVDLKDGPSTLQKRLNVPTQQELKSEPSIFEKEREVHTNTLKQQTDKLASVRKGLFNPGESTTSGLCSPSAKRDEIR